MKKLLGVLMLGVLILIGCSNSTLSVNKNITVDDVVKTFQDSGLKAEDPKEMTKDDYGMGPMKAEEGRIVKIGDDMNARVFSYKNEADLDQMKAYYDELGKESAMLFSWTIKQKNILVQLNGDLPEEEYNKYKKALEAL